jgi:hypothetical protein
MGTGGTTSTGVLRVVTLSPSTPSGIVAAAWANKKFYLLQPGSTNQFWTVDPVEGAVMGPYALPADSSMMTIGVSANAVFVASKTKVYQVGLGGSSTATSTGTFGTAAVSPVGAYATGYFLTGDAANGGKFTAQAMNDAGMMVAGATSLGAIHQVASDGSHFAVSTVDANGYHLHVLTPGTFTPNANPCPGNSFATQDIPISVAGTNVGWVYYAGGNLQLKIGPIPSGTCGSILKSNVYMSPSYAVGMIDGTDALVVSGFNITSQVTLMRLGSGTPQVLDNASNGFPQSIIVATGYSYAAVVTGGTPAVLAW